MTSIPDLPNTTPLTQDDLLIYRDVSTGVDRRGKVQEVSDLVSEFVTSEADRAETAAEVAAAAGRVFTTAADGIAATVDGDYFWVVSAESDETLELWLNDGGVASDTGKRTVSSVAVENNTTAINNRVIRVGSVADLASLPASTGYSAMCAGAEFKYDGSAWVPQDGYVTVDCFTGTDSEKLQAAIDYVDASSVISFIKVPRLVEPASTVQIRPGVSFFMTQSGAIKKSFDGPADNSVSPILSDETYGSGNNMFFGGRVVGRHENDLAAALAAQATGQRDVFLYARDGSNYYFQDVFVNGFSYNGLRFDGSSTTQDPSKIRFFSGGISYCGSNGLWCKHGINDVQFHDTECEWLGFSAIGVDDLSSGEAYGPPIARVSIIGNKIRKTSQDTLTGAIFVAAASNVTITGNTIAECGIPGSLQGNGIAVSTGGDTTVGLNECKNVTISGNTIKDVEGTGIQVNGVKESQVTGNTILNVAGVAGITLSDASPTGLAVQGCVDLSLDNNWIGSDNGSPVGRGIYVVTSNSQDVRINPNNTFVNVTDEIVDNQTTVQGEGKTQNTNVMPGYRDQRLTSFTLLLRNNGGTLEQRIVSAMFTADPDYYDGINGANDVFTALPSVTSSVGFTDGVGLQGLADVVFDTQDMTNAGMGMASVARNNTGTALDVRLEKTSGNIDGVTRDRLSVIFFEAATGDQLNINTTNIPDGTAIECQVFCLVAR